MFCQVCGLKNPDDEEFCSRCHSKLLVLSGVGVVEESGETQEEIPFDEHLLERISTLEDVVKRTGEAVKTLFESHGEPREEPLRRAHGHPGPPGDARAPRRRPPGGSRRSLGDQDGRADAGRREEGPLPRTARPDHRAVLGRPDATAFLQRLREAEFAILALDAERGVRAARGAVPRSTATTSSSASTSARRSSPRATSRGPRATSSKILAIEPNHFESLVYSAASRRRRSARRRGGRGRCSGARSSASPTPSCRTSRSARSTRTARAGRRPSGRCCGRSTSRRVPSAHVLLGNGPAREGGAVPGDRASSRRRSRLAARVRGGDVPARPLLSREELAQARARVLPAGAREEPAAARVPGGRATARAAAAATRCRAWTGPGAEAFREAEENAARGSLAPRTRSSTARRCEAEPRQPDDPHLLRAALRLARALEGGDRGVPRGPRGGARGRRCGRRLLDARRGAPRGGQAATRPREFVREFLDEAHRPRRRRPSATTSSRRASPSRARIWTRRSTTRAARSSAAPDELKPYPLAALGWVHYKRQEFDRAIDCLRRSSERAAAPTTLHHLGMAYLAAGKPRRRRPPSRGPRPSRAARRSRIG